MTREEKKMNARRIRMPTYLCFVDSVQTKSMIFQSVDRGFILFFFSFEILLILLETLLGHWMLMVTRRAQCVNETKWAHCRHFCGNTSDGTNQRYSDYMPVAFVVRRHEHNDFKCFEVTVIAVLRSTPQRQCGWTKFEMTSFEPKRLRH